MSNFLRLVTYGSSQMYGTGLPPGSLTFGQIIADQLGVEYVCRAKPLVSNDKITRTIMSQEYSNDFIIIMWTTGTRYEFKTADGWRTYTTQTRGEGFVREWYNGPASHEHTEIITLLKNIILTQQFLTAKNLPHLMPLDCDELRTSQLFNNPDTYISELKSLINWDSFVFFGDTGFAAWARDNNFAFTNDHPSTQAHKTAAEYLLEKNRFG